MPAELDLELFGYPQLDGVHLISAPQQFEGGEETYDEHIGGADREDSLRSGRGAWQLINRHATRPVHTVLEIGSGGGTCSIGLVAAAPGVQMIITDTSPAFLQMARRKMNAAGLSAQPTVYATLAGEDHGEDKHSFLITELIAGADAAGFGKSYFYSNKHFYDLADSDLSSAQGHCSFIGYLDSFLEHHHRVSPTGMRSLREFLFPLLLRMDARFRAGDGVPLFGCMVFRR
jgi:Lysine methyltransferase